MSTALLVSLLAALFLLLLVSFDLFVGLHEAAVAVRDLVEHYREDYCVHENDDEVELEQCHRWHCAVNIPFCTARARPTAAKEPEWMENRVREAIQRRLMIASKES